MRSLRVAGVGPRGGKAGQARQLCEMPEGLLNGGCGGRNTIEHPGVQERATLPSMAGRVGTVRNPDRALVRHGEGDETRSGKPQTWQTGN